MSLTKVTYSMIVGGCYNVLDFGAVADGTTDSTAAIQAAADAAIITGGTVFVPRGYYRVTAMINIGLPFYNGPNNLDFVVNTTAPIADNVDFANQNLPNKNANITKKRVDFVGEANTYIVADFAPTFAQPVIAYNLDNDSFDNTGKMSNFSVIATNQVVGGIFSPYAPYVANNLIGVYQGRGCSVSEKLFFAGLGNGLVLSRTYWSSQTSMKAYHCGIGFNFIGHNQAIGKDLNAHTCLIGYKYTGQGGKLLSFGTENCDTDIWIISADCCHFDTAYLEDVRVAPSAGTYAVQLGNTINGTQITHCTFTNILTLINPLSPKKSWRFWSTGLAVMNGCRLYAGGFDIDTISNATDFGTDQSLASTQFYNNGMLFNNFDPFIGDSFGNNFTYNLRGGSFSRIGKQVTATITISWTAIGSAGGSNLIVTLPFAAKNETGIIQSAAIGRLDGIDTGGKQVTAVVNPNQTFLMFFQTNDNAAPVPITANSCSASGELCVSITYIIQ